MPLFGSNLLGIVALSQAIIEFTIWLRKVSKVPSQELFKGKYHWTVFQIDFYTLLCIRCLDYIASPGIVIPLIVLMTLIIYYMASLIGSLREANNDLKVRYSLNKCKMCTSLLSLNHLIDSITSWAYRGTKKVIQNCWK